MPEVYLQTNAGGTLNVLEWCRKTGVNKLVLASTSSIYGANPPLPTPEDADSSHPLQIYAASKKAAEVMAYTYHHLTVWTQPWCDFSRYTSCRKTGYGDVQVLQVDREGDPVDDNR
jgi:nucleoside-diphosphate-sugar epimerase